MALARLELLADFLSSMSSIEDTCHQPSEHLTLTVYDQLCCLNNIKALDLSKSLTML